MASASRAFDNHRRGSSVFQPVEKKTAKPRDEEPAESPPPYERVHPGHPPSMRLRIRFRDGRISSYAFSDLREIHQRDAGLVQLDFIAMRAVSIIIRGRNLNELARLLDNAMVRCIDESDDRDVDRLEEEPAIVSIVTKPYLTPSD
ncbi:hypothetical protein [Rhodopirellula bahusiensis]|uniref:hypothetical protein n=1 Tax=Rhodopirellula bahusiensis TaxID=2014065 RepID=UPI003264831E